MMEVTIHWTAMPGEGIKRYLVDVPSLPLLANSDRPNPFDATQANLAIDAALRTFRAMKPLVEGRFHEPNREHMRTITRIELRQTEDETIEGFPGQRT